MMNAPSIVARLMLLVACTMSATATTYFVSATSGSNTSDGRSPATPWRTIAKINATTFLPGDSVLFRRGEVWKDTLLLFFSESGTTEAPIYIGAYGEGPRPIITDITPLARSADTIAWRARGANIWALHCPETPNRLWLDGTEVLRAAIAQDVGTTNSEGTIEWWYHDATDSTLLLHSTDNPARAFARIEGNRPAGVLALYRSAYMVIEGLDFRGGRWTTIYGGACSHVTFRDCAIGYGLSGLTLTSADTAASAHHVLIESCTFDSGMNFRYGLSSLGTASSVDATKRGNEDAVHFGHAVHDCIVRHSTFTGWGHVGINCYAPDSTRRGVHDNLFYRNTLTGSNLSYARAFATDGADGRCHHNEFRNNLVVDHTVRSQINGNDNWVHHNVFDGMTTSTAKHFGIEGSAQAILLSVYGPTLVCRNNRIEHNLFLNTAEAAVALWSHRFPHKVHGNTVRNNIFINAGSAPATQADSGVAILMRDTLEVWGNDIRNNCLFRGEGTARVRHYGTLRTVADLALHSGSHGNLFTGNIEADPLLQDLGRRNYRPNRWSPCVDVGLPIPDITLDWEGMHIPSGPAPDIGPCEYQVIDGTDGFPPVPTRSTVHPSPAREAVTITLPTPMQGGLLLLTDLRGVRVHEQHDLHGTQITLARGTLPPGVYVYRLSTGSKLVAAGLLMLE
jgi:hypothetical protein